MICVGKHLFALMVLLDLVGIAAIIFVVRTWKMVNG